jgi:hypothetical protein
MVGRARSDRSGPKTRRHWTIGNTSWNNPREDYDTLWKDKNTFDWEIWANYSSFPRVSDWTHNGASGFYEPIQYADLVCDEQVIRVVSISFNEAFANYSGTVWQKPQFWGNNPLELELHNTSDKTLDLNVEVKTSGFRGESLSDARKVSIEPGSSLTVNGRIPVREDSFQPFHVKVTEKETGRLLYNTTYVTRVPPFIEFDLEAVYQPKGVNGTIKYIPVIVSEGFEGLKAELSLYSRNDKKLIAEDRLEDFEKVNQFTGCLEGLNIDGLVSGNYYIECRLKDKEGKLVGEFDQGFTRNSYETGRKFGARKSMWDFGGITGEAVIVEYPDEKDFVLWKPANYFGMWFLNNVGLTYECGECWGYASGSCNEPMQDKKILYQNAEIVENTPARVVLRWTYALTNNNYDIFFNEWVEEYFTLFPDGNGIRKIVLWNNTGYPHEIIQPQYIFPNGVLPGQMLEGVITRVFDLKGNMEENLMGSTGGEMGYSTEWSEEILRMPLKNREDPFMIIGKTDQLMPELRLSNLLYQSAESRDIRYNLGAHWPINKLEVDVFNIVSTDMPYHSWIGLSQVQPDNEFAPNVWTHFFGVTEKDDEYLKDIAASWLHPGAVKVIKGSYEYAGFNSLEYVYSFVPRSPEYAGIRFTLTPVFREKIIHPFIVVHEYGGGEEVIVLLDGKKLDPADYSVGFVTRRRTRDLQVFLNREITGETRVEIK